MARPKKQTVDYFPHQCKHGKTMFILEQRWGNDGFSFWFKLLEQIGSSEGHFLDSHCKTTWGYLCANSRISHDVATDILNQLSDVDAIDSELWTNDGVIWIQNFVDGVKDAYKKRTNSTIPVKPSLRIRKHDSNGVYGAGNTPK